MNANTALRPNPRIWDDNVWPEELAQDKELLEQSFQHALNMLQPEPYPENWPVLQKLSTLETMAKGAGAHDKFIRPPIAVHFKDAVNPAGVAQKASTLTGNDTTGINDWSKNTTLMNYIPDAWNHGAEIFTCCNVIRVDKASKKSGTSGPYTVYFEWQEPGREAFLSDHGNAITPMFITADIVVLGAGALGSTEILLRSSKTGFKTSNQLGKHFSGNGDVSVQGVHDNGLQGVCGNFTPPIWLHSAWSKPGPSPVLCVTPCENGTTPLMRFISVPIIVRGVLLQWRDSCAWRLDGR